MIFVGFNDALNTSIIYGNTFLLEYLWYLKFKYNLRFRYLFDNSQQFLLAALGNVRLSTHNEIIPVIAL